MGEATKHVTEQSFSEDVLGADKPVVVDFWAEWCAPCRQVAPILEEIASEHSDKLGVVKLNIDENPKVAAQYGITSIPTLSVFSGGEMVQQIVGARPKKMLLKELEPYL